MRSFRNLVGSLCITLPILGAALTFAPDANAGSGFSGLDTVGNILIGCIVLGGGDLILTGSDIVYLSSGRRPATGWSITKVALGAPQVVLYSGVAAFAAAQSGDKTALIFATLASAYTGSLTANGIWLLAQERDPLSIYGFSWAIGANTAFTSAAIGTVVGKKWPGRAFGIVEMVATAPSLVVGAIRIADPKSEYVAWGALMGWSGVLFTHGLVSALHKDRYEREAGVVSGGFQPRVHFGPTMVTDGIQRAPGFSVGGVF
jgi:hypothetical protein